MAKHFFKRKSRSELTDFIWQLGKTLPEELAETNDAILLHQLLDVLAEEQRNLASQSRALLCGVMAVLARRVTANMPTPARVNKEGVGAFSLDELAEHLKLNPEQTDRLQADIAAGKIPGARLLDDDELLFPVN